MQSEFQKQQAANKIDWKLVGITVVLCGIVFYQVIHAIH